MQMLAPFAAGLGLFFCGAHFLSANLTPLAGRRFRVAITRLLDRPGAAIFAGILAGVVTQSAHAVTYVIIGLVSSGVVDKRRAILIPTWSHVGTSVLVILVALSFSVAVSYIVALAGFAIYFGVDRSDRARHLVGALLGVGLLFLGLEAMKSGSLPVRDVLIGEGIVARLAGHPLLLLVTGLVVTLACQSSSVVSAITVAATGAALFDLDGAIWLVFGSNLGSGLNNLILARTSRGEASQIATIQGVQKAAGFLIMSGLVALETMTGRPLFAPVTTVFAQTPSGQLAVIFLAYQVAGSLFCTLFLRQIIATLERLLPPSSLQEMSKPAFLVDEALVEPTLAIDLVEREKRRLQARLPLMLDEIRADVATPGASSETIRAAAVAVTRAMSDYMEQIGEQDLDRADRERVVRLQHRTANQNVMFEAVAEFVTASRDCRQWPSSAQVAGQMVEALHALLTALVEATESGDSADRELVLSLLGHRDEMMERMRRRVLREDPDMPPKAQETLFSTTMLFERIVWLARRSALLLDARSASSEMPAEAAA